MANKVTPIGSEFQVNKNIFVPPSFDGTAFGQIRPSVAALTDGRFAVVYNSQPSATGNDDIHFAIVDSNGNVGSKSFVYRATGLQGPSAVAGRLDGGFGVAWSDELTSTGAADSHPNNINYRTVSGDGVLGPVIAVGDGLGNMANLAITTLSDGRQVVVFDDLSDFANGDIFLNVVSATGTATAFAPSVLLPVDTSGPVQQDPSIAAQGLNAMIVYEDATGGSGPFDENISGRIFNGATNTVGAVIPIADHDMSIFQPDVAAIGGGRYVIVYTDGSHIYSKIYNPVTGTLTPEVIVDTSPSAGTSTDNAQVAGTADGGFVVTWGDFGGPPPDTNGSSVHERRFDLFGHAFGDDFVVNTTTTNDQQFSDLAVSGSNVLTAWEDYLSHTSDVSPPGIRAQAATLPLFDFDSAQYGDFNANGRADILFQNVSPTADAAIWQTNSSGVLSSITAIGPVPSGFRIDGTGNFNSSSGDDILLRSTNSVAVLPMNGISPQPVRTLGGVPTEFLNSGIGDFTGDGQDDLLFRNINTGEIATWGVANNALSAAPKVLGSTAPQFHIVAVDDFTGDHQADILFRHDNGDIAIWRVANNSLAGAPSIVGSTSTAFHVVGTGDFDGNGSNDILFRNDIGDLAIWLLNSQGQLLSAPAAIGNAGSQFHVDGTGDLNGDGRADIVFRDANGTLVEWLMNGTSFAAPPAVLGGADDDYSIAAHHFDLV
jgi:hypothetical protein